MNRLLNRFLNALAGPFTRWESWIAMGPVSGSGLHVYRKHVRSGRLQCKPLFAGTGWITLEGGTLSPKPACCAHHQVQAQEAKP